MTHSRFPRTSRWRRGYHCRQVDAFLARVDLSLTGAFPPLAAAGIRRTGFELVRHGYKVAVVDAHLDELEERAVVVESATSARRGRTDPESDVQFLRDRLDEPHLHRFPRSGRLRRGYNIGEVDDFVDHVLARFDARNDTGVIELTVEDVRGAGFNRQRGGYAEEAVDETLDRVVELLLVQRRASDNALPWHSQEPDVEASGPST